jgi:hypothetical protein
MSKYPDTKCTATATKNGETKEILILTVEQYEREHNAKDAEIARLREEIASSIIRAGLATGHGDTVTDMLNEMVEQVVELSNRAESLSAVIEKVMELTEKEVYKYSHVHQGIIYELKAILPPK